MCLEMSATMVAAEECCDLDGCDLELGAPAALTKAARRRVRQRLRKKLGKAMAAAEEEEDFLQLQQLQDSLRQPQPLQHLQQLQEQLRRPQNHGNSCRPVFEHPPILQSLPQQAALKVQPSGMPQVMQQEYQYQQEGEKDEPYQKQHHMEELYIPATPFLLPRFPCCQIPVVNKYMPMAAWVPEPVNQPELPYHHVVTICAVQDVKQLSENPQIDTMEIVLNLPSRKQESSSSLTSQASMGDQTCDKGNDSESDSSSAQGLRSWASTPIPVARTFIHFDDGVVETARHRSKSV